MHFSSVVNFAVLGACEAYVRFGLSLLCADVRNCTSIKVTSTQMFEGYALCHKAQDTMLIIWPQLFKGRITLSAE